MSTIFCPNCDHANSPDSKFCSNCGHRLPPSTEIICPNCQTPNPRTLFYCDHCGARLVRETLPTEVESDPDLDDEVEPFVHPTDLFSLPTRKPGDTGKLDLNMLPDWLRAGGRGEDEDEPVDVDSPESPEIAETPARRDASGELPDWLVTDSSVELYQPPSEISTEAYLEMTEGDPLGLSESTNADNDLNLPDWLTDAVKDTNALIEKKPTRSQPDEAKELPNPFETSTNIPEWLAEVGGLTAASTTPDKDKEEDEEIPTVADWGFSPSAYEESPDWLMDSAEAPAETGAEYQTAPDLSGLQEWGTAVASSALLPDWYGELARPSHEKLNIWLSELEDLEEPEFTVDQPESSSVAARLTDWLSESDEPARAGADDKMVTGMLTGWLSELNEEEEADYQEESEESEKRLVTGMLTGWLAELDTEDESNIPDETNEGDEPIPGQFTGWLADADDSEEDDLLTAAPDTDQLTSWLADSVESVESDFFEETTEAEELEPDQFTDWLAAANNDRADLLPEAPGTDQLTSWLMSDDESVEPHFLEDLVEDETPEPDQLTGWLTPTGDDDEADSLTELPDTDQFTNWLEDEADLDDLNLVEDESESDEDITTGRLTSWLSELEEEEGEPEEKAVTGMLTGWLAELGESSEADFLDDKAEEEAEEEVVAGRLTGWLAELDEDDGADFPDDEAVAEELEQDIVADWLPDSDDWEWADEKLEDEKTSDEPYALETPLPLASEESSPDALSEEEAAEAFPDWLADLRQAEEQGAGQQSDLVQADLPAWLSNMKPSEDTDGSSLPGLGLDVDLSDDFAEIPPELSGADLPDWLHVPTSSGQREGDLASAEYSSDTPDWLRPDDGEPIQQRDYSGQLRSILSELPPPRDPREGLVKADIPEWVDALKPKSLTGSQRPESAAPAPESGPLRGVSGVIEIAPVMAVSNMAHELPVNQLTITPEQQQQAELLQQLAQGELLLSEAAVSPRRRLPWSRLLLSLILLAAMSAAVLLDAPLSLIQEDGGPAPLSIEAAQTAVTAAAGQPVLVAFDYTPALEGELATEAAALMAQLAANASPVIAVTQSAAGTAIAATYTDNPTLFIPGEAIGLRQLGTCLAEGCELLFGRSLENDLSQVSLIIVLTGERKSLVNWIEQVGSQTDVPVLAATTESLEPLAMSYMTSGQLDGLFSHLAALGRYENTLPVATADPVKQRALDAQVMVQLALAVLLLFGLIGQLRRTAMSRNR